MADIKHVKKWLEYSQNDYDAAVVLESTVWPKFLEAVCYHCQQSIEKALKAVLAYYNADIPKTHNIEELSNKCKQYDASIIIERKLAQTMTRFATTSRYPDFDTLLIEGDAELALKIAKQVLDMVKQTLNIAEDGQKEKTDQPDKVPE